MGIVKISDQLHDAAKVSARAWSRSVNAQAEHWMRIGKMIEDHPEMTFRDVLQTFLQEAASAPAECHD
jgi:ParD-like antitoxin of type II bacterial toxin-antitoxin system